MRPTRREEETRIQEPVFSLSSCIRVSSSRCAPKARNRCSARRGVLTLPAEAVTLTSWIFVIFVGLRVSLCVSAPLRQTTESTVGKVGFREIEQARGGRRKLFVPSHQNPRNGSGEWTRPAFVRRPVVHASPPRWAAAGRSRHPARLRPCSRSFRCSSFPARRAVKDRDRGRRRARVAARSIRAHRG